jgi:hypothetical protein
MVTVADAALVGSAALTAFTVTVSGLGTSTGAVYSPLEVMVPPVLSPPATPFTCQITFLSPAPSTAAVNRIDRLTRTAAVAGAMLTETGVSAIRAILYGGDTCPSGLVTLTGIAEPAAEVEPEAVSHNADPKLVASGVEPSVTIAPTWKLLPVTVSSTLPVFAGFGFTELIVGAGDLTVAVAVRLMEGIATSVA